MIGANIHMELLKLANELQVKTKGKSGGTEK